MRIIFTAVIAFGLILSLIVSGYGQDASDVDVPPAETTETVIAEQTEAVTDSEEQSTDEDLVAEVELSDSLDEEAEDVDEDETSGDVAEEFEKLFNS